jgi:hypothetical protein
LQNYGGLYATLGAQLNIKLGTRTDSLSKIKSTYGLRLGVAGMLRQNINVTSDILNETYTYNANGATTPIDTVSYHSSVSGKVALPTVFNAGFMIVNQQSLLGVASDYKWMIGAEMSVGKWGDEYQYPTKPEPLTNSWMLRTGVQFVPSPFSTTSGVLGHAIYRFGFYTGKDYMNADGNELKVSAFTFGAGFRYGSSTITITNRLSSIQLLR